MGLMITDNQFQAASCVFYYYLVTLIVFVLAKRYN